MGRREEREIMKGKTGGCQKTGGEKSEFQLLLSSFLPPKLNDSAMTYV